MAYAPHVSMLFYNDNCEFSMPVIVPQRLLNEGDASLLKRYGTMLVGSLQRHLMANDIEMHTCYWDSNQKRITGRVLLDYGQIKRNKPIIKTELQKIYRASKKISDNEANGTLSSRATYPEEIFQKLARELD